MTAGIAPVGALAERYAFVTHAADGDAWWQTVRNAADLAATQMGVEIDHLNPVDGAPSAMPDLFAAVRNGGYDGLITTLPDFEFLRESIEDTSKGGIDLVVVNAGTAAQADALGAVMFIGQPDYAAGFAAGRRARDEGVDSFLCINDRPEVLGAHERCLGFADGVGVDLADRMLDGSRGDIVAQIDARLAADRDLDAVFTLSSASAHHALQAIANVVGREVYHASFDLDPLVVEAISDGRTAFAIDQQQFLQGYMPVIVLANLHRFGVLPANDIDSGPGFVTRDNLHLVARHAGSLR